MENSIQKRKGAIHDRYGSVIIKSLKARIQTMSFPTYINFQVNNTGRGRNNMVVHSHAVILMLLSLCPGSFGIFDMIVECFLKNTAFVVDDDDEKNA